MRSPNSRKSGSRFAARQSESNIERLEDRTLLSSVVVNTTADSTDAVGSKTKSLRDAIAIANAATSTTTITFDTTVFKTAKTITMTNHASLEFTNKAHSTTVIGPTAALTVDGQQAVTSSNNFLIDAGVTVSISNLRTTRGAFTSFGNITLNNVTAFNDVVSTGFGGGIANEGGVATLTNVSIANNKVGGQGAGIYNTGTMTLTRCTISGNAVTSGDNGGGIYSAGTLTMTNTTVANNSAGGGLDIAGGTATIKDSTVTGNHASLNGGGVFNASTASVTIANSLIAGNSAGGVGPDADGTYKSLGHNFIGKTDGSSGWLSSDYKGTVSSPLNAKLGALANNGGLTQTMLPQTASPLIDKGSNSLIPSGTTTDQRGLLRTYNGTVDIGAVEVQPLIQIKAPANQTAIIGVSKSVTLGSFTQYTNTGPFKDTITWGDGSASTVLSLTAAGTIPATAHAFAKLGKITVSETITDAKGNKSNTVTFTETVTGAVGSIAGTVFDDANGDGKIDNGEFGVGLWTVYLDLNKDGKLDTGDKSVTTDINGKFSFTALAAGTYVVRVVPVTGTVATKPTTNMQTIALGAGQNSTGNLFGEKAVA